jgi:hypothetical protein
LRACNLRRSHSRIFDNAVVLFVRYLGKLPCQLDITSYQRCGSGLQILLPVVVQGSHQQFSKRVENSYFADTARTIQRRFMVNGP